MADESLTKQAQAGDEQELIQRIRGGDNEQFAGLVNRYEGHVVRIVGRRVPADCVEEVARDVFVRAYFGLVQFSSDVPFDHWLAGIAVRTCYDFWRNRKREEVPVSTLTDDHHRWIEQALAAQSDDEWRSQTGRQEAKEVLAWALSHLSPENRAVLTLVHLDGHSVREAAQLLGWSVVTVKVRAHRARHALHKILSHNL